MHIRLSSRWAVAALLLLVPVALFAKPPLDDDGNGLVGNSITVAPPMGTALGTATAAGPATSTTLAGVTVPSGSTLIVCYGEISDDVFSQPTSAAFDGNDMNLVFLSPASGTQMGSAIYYYYSATTTTGDIVIVSSGVAGEVFQAGAIAARGWTRIADPGLDVLDIEAATGASLALDLELNQPTLTTGICTAAAAHFSGVTGTWAANYTAGQTASIGALVLKEAYRSPSGNTQAQTTATLNFTGSIESCGILANFLREP